MACVGGGGRFSLLYSLGWFGVIGRQISIQFMDTTRDDMNVDGEVQ
jgi:hypothetical protein